MAGRTPTRTVTRRKTAPRARTKGAADQGMIEIRHFSDQGRLEFTPSEPPAPKVQVSPACAICGETDPALVYHFDSDFLCARHLIKAGRMASEFWPGSVAV